MRTALELMTMTVLEPVMTMASFSGLIGLAGLGVSSG